MDNQTLSKKSIWQKRPASRDKSDGSAVKRPIIGMGFNERPMRHLPAFMALKPADKHPKAPTLEHPKDPDISSLHNFIQNKQTAGQMSDACKLGSLNDVFASCPATNLKNLGGGGRDRTDDPLLAKQVLSQLSYAPVRYG
jgi:hypothetical protein